RDGPVERRPTAGREIRRARSGRERRRSRGRGAVRGSSAAAKVAGTGEERQGGGRSRAAGGIPTLGAPWFRMVRKLNQGGSMVQDTAESGSGRQPRAARAARSYSAGGEPSRRPIVLMSSSTSGQWIPEPSPMGRQFSRCGAVARRRRGYHSRGAEISRLGMLRLGAGGARRARRRRSDPGAPDAGRPGGAGAGLAGQRRPGAGAGAERHAFPSDGRVPPRARAGGAARAAGPGGSVVRS